MDAHRLLAVTNSHALRFFFEHLRDVTEDDHPAERELLYNASVLAHFASTSAASFDFPGAPSSLTQVFDIFVMDRSQHSDPEILEAAGSQCLLLTGFFGAQLRGRHNVDWFATLGADFYGGAARRAADGARAHMMRTMARRFPFWRRQQARLARELHDSPMLLPRPAAG
jgi:hypothetical protein